MYDTILQSLYYRDMVFSSITFLLYFLPPFLVAYRLGGVKFQNTILLVASVVFYAWGAMSFLPILLASCVIHFYLVRELDKLSGNKRARAVAASVILNVGLLVYFKYANFIVENITPNHFEWSDIALPIGISFFTFQSLSYSLDVHRRTVKPLNKLSEYMVYILSFPQMIAGPIVRFTEVERELRRRTVANSDWLNGFYRFAIGLSKKVLIANTLASIFPLDIAVAAGGFDGWSAPHAFIAILAYTFQIYFDFSGYSDMAIGLGRMLGFRFPENFKQPYRATSITDFWRRWHITLSSWLRDYLYIPLGGNRVSTNARLYMNLGFVFAISGLWHGASWNFLIWGLYHGTFLILERIFLREWLNNLPRFLSRIITFFIVVVGWVFFAIEDFDLALRFLCQLIDGGFMSLEVWSQELYNLTSREIVVLSAAIIFTSTALYDKLKLDDSKPVLMAMLGVGLWLVSVSYLAGSDFNPFIYFRF
jgi:alginate O-acetyltransferase complex protein AlgI